MAVLIFRAARITFTGGLTKTIDAKLIADAIPGTFTKRWKLQQQDMNYITYNKNRFYSHNTYLRNYLINLPVHTPPLHAEPVAHCESLLQY